MGIFNKKKEVKQEVKEVHKPLIILNNSYENSKNKQLKEKAKVINDVSFANALLKKTNIVEHPFSFDTMKGLYKTYPLITGIVEKYVDYIMGSGFTVETNELVNNKKKRNETAQELLNSIMRELEFPTKMRDWIREAIITGNSFLNFEFTSEGKEGRRESLQFMQLVNSDTMFVRRDDEGDIEGYVQTLGNSFISRVDQIEEFDPDTIAHLIISPLSDAAYGCGVIYPLRISIDNALEMRKNLITLMGRKANSPIIIRAGMDGKRVSSADMNSFKQDLQFFNNSTEWVMDSVFDAKTLDFGNFGEKFSKPLEMVLDEIRAGSQVPEVLLGSGQLNEGIARVQMQAWIRNIQSKQEYIEKVIEKKIFRPLLIKNGFENVHAEIIWSQPSEDDRKEEVKNISEMLKNSLLSPKLRELLEKRLANQMGFEEFELEEPEEERRREEEEVPQPRVPGQNKPTSTKQSYSCDHKEISEMAKKDVSLKEWLGFNYLDYQDYIVSEINKDSFDLLLAKTQNEIVAGKLTETQVQNLKRVLVSGFLRKKTIVEISEDIDKKVGLTNLYQLDENGELKKNANGDLVLAYSKETRPNVLARTETTRLSNLGVLNQYEDNGFKEAVFVATPSQRTCPQCEALDGKVMPIAEARNIIPVHTYCRCTWVAKENL